MTAGLVLRALRVACASVFVLGAVSAQAMSIRELRTLEANEKDG